MDGSEPTAAFEGRKPERNFSYVGDTGWTAPFTNCKVDDPAGHRLQEIIAVREVLHKVFSIEGTMRSVEVVEVFPFVEFDFKIDIALCTIRAGKIIVDLIDGNARPCRSVAWFRV